MSAISSSTTSQIERMVCDYSGKQLCLLTGSGTSAIYLALKASGLPVGSKIAIPNITCPDPAYATIWAGYIPVFVDVSVEDYNIDVSALEQVLSTDQDIKGVIAIHLFGNACQIARISELTRKHDLFFIEDCAQALGNTTADGKLGSFGHVSIFSFGRGKIVEADHGGALCTNEQEFVDRVRTFETELVPHDAQSIAGLARTYRRLYYWFYFAGQYLPALNILNRVFVAFFKKLYLFRLDESQLPNILAAMNRFKENSEAAGRAAKVAQYVDQLQATATVTLPVMRNVQNSLTRLTVLVPDAERISSDIRKEGIPSNTMYPMLVDRFQLFFDKTKYSNSLQLRGRSLNLWTNEVSDEDVQRTVELIKQRVAG